VDGIEMSPSLKKHKFMFILRLANTNGQTGDWLNRIWHFGLSISPLPWHNANGPDQCTNIILAAVILHNFCWQMARIQMNMVNMKKSKDESIFVQ
jgi:hypothetical protein